MFKQNWFGIDDFLLNFFATFVSVLGLQVTVGLQVNTGLQPPTRWEPFVAGMGAIRWGTRGTRPPTFSDSEDILCHVLPYFLFTL